MKNLLVLIAVIMAIFMTVSDGFAGGESVVILVVENYDEATLTTLAKDAHLMRRDGYNILEFKTKERTVLFDKQPERSGIQVAVFVKCNPSLFENEWIFLGDGFNASIPSGAEVMMFVGNLSNVRDFPRYFTSVARMNLQNISPSEVERVAEPGTVKVDRQKYGEGITRYSFRVKESTLLEAQPSRFFPYMAEIEIGTHWAYGVIFTPSPFIAPKGVLVRYSSYYCLPGKECINPELIN
jgi:hypothetical protein